MFMKNKYIFPEFMIKKNHLCKVYISRPLIFIVYTCTSTYMYMHMCVYMYTRSVQMVSSYVIWKIETCIKQDTRYKKHCTQDNDTSVPFKVDTWDLAQLFQLPPAVPLYFPEFHWWSKISSPPKVILVWGEARSHIVPHLGCREAESPGWFDGSPKNSARDMTHEQACCYHEAVNHELPIDADFWIIQIVSMEECLSLTKNSMHISCSTHSVI